MQGDDLDAEPACQCTQPVCCTVATHLSAAMLDMLHLSAVATLSIRCWAGARTHAIAQIPSCIVGSHRVFTSHSLYLHPHPRVRCRAMKVMASNVAQCASACSTGDIPVPGLGVLLLADTNGLTDGMPGGRPGWCWCCGGGGGGGHMPPTPGGGPPLCPPHMALLLLWLLWPLLPSLMLRCCSMNWWRGSMKPSLYSAPLPELMADMLASLQGAAWVFVKRCSCDLHALSSELTSSWH
jgi:hypothetical protein